MAVQMDNLRGLLGIRRIDEYRMQGLESYSEKQKGLMKIFSISLIERMNYDRIAKNVYVGECVGSRVVGRPWKRWIDSVNDYLNVR